MIAEPRPNNQWVRQLYYCLVLTEEVYDPRACEHCYVRSSSAHGEDCYVCISVGIDPRDVPWQVSVSLGQGSLAFPERDWNALPLWRLVQASDPESKRSYSFQSAATLTAALESGARDLRTYGHEFLQGDLTQFKPLRSQMNASREPYQIHKLDPLTGRYKTEVDVESAKLKDRFSGGR